MKSLIGVWPLIRLALRRDRIKLPLWILGIVGTVAANIPAVMSFYGGSQEKILLYASTTAPSVVSRVFNGPIYGPNIGEIIMNETFLFTAVAAAFMSTLAIVRHTRQNEETGRAELIGSAVVGRHASMTAALIVMAGANVVLGALVTLTAIGNKLPATGSIGMGAGVAVIGITFGAVAAITSQVSESSRGANSMAAIAIAVAFLLRALGDGTAKLVNNGLSVQSAWPSWLSPFGWGQQMYPYATARWWLLGLFAALFVALGTTAYVLNARRDQGLGMISTRRGRAHAKPSLLSAQGLAWRLQRGTLRGWAIGVLIMGVTVGFISDEFKDLFKDNPDVAKALGQVHGTVSFADLFFAAMMGFMAVALAGYVVQSLVRMRSEEASGHLEPVLATHVSRTRWMCSHIGITVFGTALLLVLFGVSAGATYVLITNGQWSEVIKITKAALIHFPALLAFAGFVIATFGILPRWTVAVSWASFAVCYLLMQFGVVLELPRKVLDLSPFAHTPAYPMDAIRYAPLFILLAVAGALTAAGLVVFRRRDITTT